MNCSQWIWPASVGTNMRLKNEAASFQKPTCGKELKHDILILSLANLELDLCNPLLSFKLGFQFEAVHKANIFYPFDYLLMTEKHAAPKKRFFSFLW